MNRNDVLSAMRNLRARNVRELADCTPDEEENNELPGGGGEQSPEGLSDDGVPAHMIRIGDDEDDHKRR